MTYPKVAECGTVRKNDWPISAVSYLAIGRDTIAGREVTMAHLSDGYEIAGSAMRWCNECYRVATMIDGAMHGRRFASIHDAWDEYNRRTGQGA